MLMPLPARERPVAAGRFFGADAIALRRCAIALARASRACHDKRLGLSCWRHTSSSVRLSCGLLQCLALI